MFAIREAFHPTARPKHKMHIRFFGPQTDGPPLDRRTLYPRSTASAYGNSDVRETRRTVRTKHRGFLAGAISNGPRGRPFAAKAGAPKIARPRRGRRPARLSFYTERRGLSIPPTGISVPECGKSAGPSPSCPFSAPYAWIPARERSESHAPRVGMRRSPPLVPACGRSEREEGEKALSLPVSRRPHDGAGGSFLLGRKLVLRHAAERTGPVVRQVGKGHALRLLVIHIIADLANVLHSRFSSC